MHLNQHLSWFCRICSQQLLLGPVLCLLLRWLPVCHGPSVSIHSYHGQQMITKNKNRSFHSHDILRLEFVINYQYNDIADSFLCMDSEEEESNSINEDPTEMINENSNAESFLGGVDVTLFINGEEQPSAFHSMNGVLYPGISMHLLSDRQ